MQRCFCLRQRGLRAHVPCVSKRWVPSCTRRSGVIWGDPRMQEIWLRAPPSTEYREFGVDALGLSKPRCSCSEHAVRGNSSRPEGA